MRTTLRIIPRTLDLIMIVLFGASLFLLSPIGKPLITERLVDTGYRPIPSPIPQTSLDIGKVTYFPDGHKSYEVTLIQDISVSLSLSGEAVHYSVVYRIINVYNLIDELQSTLTLAGVYLYIRMLWICTHRLARARHSKENLLGC